MDRAETLTAAQYCVNGAREQDYGTPEDNFQVIADFWNVYVNHTCIDPDGKVVFDPHDVAIMMSLMKHGRICSGKIKEDNYVDGCGYLACAAEIATEKTQPDIETNIRLQGMNMLEVPRK